MRTHRTIPDPVRRTPAAGRPPVLRAGVCMFLLCGCGQEAAPPPRPAAQDVHLAAYRLAWQDEFDGAAVDKAKWNFRSGPAWWSTQQKQNVSVSGGVMRIALRKEKAGRMDYTAGGLISKPAFRYGYYEARFRCPPGAGWHTSFWLMGTTNTQQEIDICENDSINPRRYSVNTHRYQPVHTSVGFKTVETPDLSADFHIWGGEFTPQRVTYYFDGRVVASFPVDQMAHGDHSIWLTSLAASLGGTERVDDGRLPAAAEYDYVRFFEPPTPYAPAQRAAALPAEPVTAFGLHELHVRGGLPQVAARLAAGGTVRVAYLGGSITEDRGWRNFTREWLQKQYRRAKVEEIHAAISGSGSDFAACRLRRELLGRKPDLLFVEFAVNDGGMDPRRVVRTMEGIVRQTRQANAAADICFIYTLAEGQLKSLQAGRLPAAVAAMEQVAAHYGLPSINFGVPVAKLHQEGSLQFKGKRDEGGDRMVFSGDGTHPHFETGHFLYAESFIRAWPALSSAAAVPGAWPAPLDPENWERARLVSFDQLTREGAWTRLKEDAPQLSGTRVNGRVQGRLESDPPWVATRAGAAVSCVFTGRILGLYGLKGPDGGLFRVTVDDAPPVEAALFDSYCTAGRWRIKPWFFPGELPDGPHRVRVEVLGKPAVSGAKTSAGTALYLDSLLVEEGFAR